MKRREFDQLREMPIESLRELLKKTELEGAKTRMEIFQNKQKNVHAYLTIRRRIARIKTLIAEKEVFLPKAGEEKANKK
jgi:ribosomal protein L29